MAKSLESEVYTLADIKHATCKVCMHIDHEESNEPSNKAFSSVGVQTVEPTQRLIWYDHPCLGHQIIPQYFPFEPSSDTDITEVVDLRVMKDVIIMLLDEVYVLRGRVRSAKRYLHAEYTQKLQEKSMELYCQINEKVRALEEIQKKKLETVRRAFRQQLADAIARMRGHYKHKLIRSKQEMEYLQSRLELKKPEKVVQELRRELQRVLEAGKQNEQRWLVEKARLWRVISLKSLKSVQQIKEPSPNSEVRVLKVSVVSVGVNTDRRHSLRTGVDTSKGTPVVSRGLKTSPSVPAEQPPVSHTPKKTPSATSARPPKAAPHKATKRPAIAPLHLRETSVVSSQKSYHAASPSSYPANKSSALSTESKGPSGDASILRVLDSSSIQTFTEDFQPSEKTSEPPVNDTGFESEQQYTPGEPQYTPDNENEPQYTRQRSKKSRTTTSERRRNLGAKGYQRAFKEDVFQSQMESPQSSGATLLDIEPLSENGLETSEATGNLSGDGAEGLFTQATESGEHEKRTVSKAALSEKSHRVAETEVTRKTMRASFSSRKSLDSRTGRRRTLRRSIVSDTRPSRTIKLKGESSTLLEDDRSQELPGTLELQRQSMSATHSLQQRDETERKETGSGVHEKKTGSKAAHSEEIQDEPDAEETRMTDSGMSGGRDEIPSRTIELTGKASTQPDDDLSQDFPGTSEPQGKSASATLILQQLDESMKEDTENVEHEKKTGSRAALSEEIHDVAEPEATREGTKANVVRLVRESLEHQRRMTGMTDGLDKRSSRATKPIEESSTQRDDDHSQDFPGTSELQGKSMSATPSFQQMIETKRKETENGVLDKRTGSRAALSEGIHDVAEPEVTREGTRAKFARLMRESLEYQRRMTDGLKKKPSRITKPIAESSTQPNRSQDSPGTSDESMRKSKNEKAAKKLPTMIADRRASAPAILSHELPQSSGGTRKESITVSIDVPTGALQTRKSLKEMPGTIEKSQASKCKCKMKKFYKKSSVTRAHLFNYLSKVSQSRVNATSTGGGFSDHVLVNGDDSDAKTVTTDFVEEKLELQDPMKKPSQTTTDISQDVAQIRISSRDVTKTDKALKDETMAECETLVSDISESSKQLPQVASKITITGNSTCLKTRSDAKVTFAEGGTFKPAKKKSFEFEDVSDGVSGVGESESGSFRGPTGQGAPAMQRACEGREMLLQEKIKWLERELKTINQFWEKKYSTLQASLFVLKNESYLRQTLQKRAARLHQASVSYFTSVAKETPEKPVSEHSPFVQGPKAPLPGIPSAGSKRPDPDSHHGKESPLGCRIPGPSFLTEVFSGADQEASYEEEDLPEEFQPLPDPPRQWGARVSSDRDSMRSWYHSFDVG